jgi:hypothetical protein
MYGALWLLHLIVRGRREADATRFSDPLKPSRDVDAIAKNVIALNKGVAEVDPDPVQHTPVLGDTAVPLGRSLAEGVQRSCAE